MGSKKALVGLLTPPLLWLVVAYLGALVAIFATAFFTTDPFTNEVVPTFTTENFKALLSPDLPAHHRPHAAHRGHWSPCCASSIAVPFAYFMARVAPRRLRHLLVAAVLVPLWASYLVKAYAWRTMVQPSGVLDSTFGTTPGYGFVGGRPHADLPVAAVHDPPGVCRLRATPGVAPGGLGGPGCQGAAHVPAGRPAGRSCRRSRPGPSSRSR